MDCFRCKSANPIESKYCGACGAPLDFDALVATTVQAQLKDELNAKVKEQKIVTVEITDAVRERLLGWVKWLGIAATVITSALAVVGIKSVSDIVNRAKEFEKTTNEQMDHIKALADRATIGATDVTELERKTTAKLAAIDEKLQERVSRLQEVSNENTQQLTELSKAVRSLTFQKPPKGHGQIPYHLALDTLLGTTEAARLARADKLLFQITGNTGGVKNSSFQQLVANAMTQAFAANNPNDRPAFLYLLGNIVYYNGLTQEYYPQFYAPYAKYPAPIFAIPGNHDGSTLMQQDAPNQPVEPSLFAYMQNFCASVQKILPEAGGSGRKSMIEPNSFWTLTAKLATIIGLYTNVPSGGALDDDQRNWLVSELRNAPNDRALILTMHHSPYSADIFHSGSPYMTAVLQDAINKAGRVPNLVLSASMNLYQRFEVTIASGQKVPFLVVGTGGYWRLHKLEKVRQGDWDDAHKVQFMAGVDDRHGFLTLEITKTTITGKFVAVSQQEGTSSPFVQTADAFSYSAEPIILAANQKVEMLSAGAKSANADQQ
jgi:acid phosphatase type 7